MLLLTFENTLVVHFYDLIAACKKTNNDWSRSIYCVQWRISTVHILWYLSQCCSKLQQWNYCQLHEGPDGEIFFESIHIDDSFYDITKTFFIIKTINMLYLSLIGNWGSQSNETPSRYSSRAMSRIRFAKLYSPRWKPCCNNNYHQFVF